jgi:hypothetical protein
VHVGAINPAEPVKPARKPSVLESLIADVRAVEDQSTSEHPVLAIVNHPNFGPGIDAETIARSKARFVEVYNGHPYTQSEGTAFKPSVERSWDVANTIRLGNGDPPLFGVAVDDAHAYGGPGVAQPGRGWVMVRARELTATALTVSMKRGEVYSSTGVELAGVAFSRVDRTLRLAVAAEPGVKYEIRFVGTRLSALSTADDRRDGIGETFASSEATSATYSLTGDELYVRAVVTADKPQARAAEPAFERAWTQPMGWERPSSRPVVASGERAAQ